MLPERRRYLAVACVAFVLTAIASCGSREVLPTRSASVPAGIDLGGQWHIAPDSRDTIERLHNSEIAAAGGRSRLLPDARPTRSNDDSLVHIFVETGESLKVTQTDHALFISFDRAIVEEYRFGEYRTISVGEVTASRSSGWEDGGYLIETLDNDGSKLREHYLLSDDGQTLFRHITIYKRQSVALSVVQRFERQ